MIEQWRARAWAAYARGDSLTAHVLWACADQLQEALVTDETLHLTDHWPVAPGHELSQDDWDAIKAAADEWAGRSDDGQWSPQIPAYVDIPYPGAGGRKDSGTATKQLWVIHTAECPLSTGYARSLSLWSASSTVQASWHRMSDPGTVARFVPPGRAAWHATIANRISGPESLLSALPHLLGYQLLRTNDGVTMRPWACPVGREGGLRVV